MVILSDTEFEKIIADSIDRLPDRYMKNAKNVVIVWEHDPSREQRVKMKLRPHDSLFGLYEGIPLTRRGDGYAMVLPDKITIFKNPTLQYCHNIQEVHEQVLNTLWHEIAHHYGLDHDRIHQLEDEAK